MTEMGFDLQAAWLRRFSTDAQSNLGALALRLKEALPELVHIHEKKGFFSKSGTVVGVEIDLGENRYKLDLQQGRVISSIALVSRGIVLNTKQVDPVIWFAKLREETQSISTHAQSLSRSLQSFMET